MSQTQKLTRTALMLALTLVFQFGFRQFAQPAVGPLVNMMLIITTLVVGPVYAIFIGIITPLIAFLVGISPLLPLIPMIALGNAIFIVVFAGIIQFLKFNLNTIPAVILGALFKFAFLYTAVRHLLTLFVAEVKPPVIAAFSLPQLYTALIGGIAAIIIYRLLPKKILAASLS